MSTSQLKLTTIEMVDRGLAHQIQTTGGCEAERNAMLIYFFARKGSGVMLAAA